MLSRARKEKFTNYKRHSDAAALPYAFQKQIVSTSYKIKYSRKTNSLQIYSFSFKWMPVNKKQVDLQAMWS